MRIPILVAFLAIAAPTAAAERNYSVVSFDRIRVDGAYRVTLTNGVAPFATAIGSAQALDGVSIEVSGRTLIIRASPITSSGYPGSNRGPVEIAIGTHELSAAWVNGSGSLAIDQVKGLTFDLSVQGAGAASMARVDVDQLRIGLAGAASARAAGRALRLTAVVRGSSALDGAELDVKDATIGAEGPAIAKLSVSDSAKVDARGTAAITFSGAPACILKTEGSASVEGCK